MVFKDTILKKVMEKYKLMQEMYKDTLDSPAKYRLSLLLGKEIDECLFRAFYSSKWVAMLKENQQEDGGFGRFHTRNSHIKQKYPTTEKALDSINILGLQRGNDLVDRLCCYMEGILCNDIDWPDGFEKNKWYKVAQPLFVVSKLSSFGSSNRSFFQICEKWIEILEEAFKNGEYNAERLNTVSKKLLGVVIDDSYIGLNSLYVIELFSNLCSEINGSTQKCYLNWLHQCSTIYYTGTNLIEVDKTDFSKLYNILFHVSKFSCFIDEFYYDIEKIRHIYCTNGLWDFGSKFKIQKLSDDWRNKTKKICDHTILAWLVHLE